MTIRELKNQIESNVITDDLIIFECPDSPFLANQYIKEISKRKNKPIRYEESIEPFLYSHNDIFYNELDVQIDPDLRVCHVDQYSYTSTAITHEKNFIIITNIIKNSESRKLLEKFIVTLPKLENWQIKDWAYSLLPGIPRNQIDWMLQITNSDVYRVCQIIDKITLFNEAEQQYLFEAMVSDGEFEDLTSFNIFNYTSAIMNKDYESLAKIYHQIKSVDINEFGLLKILIQNFKSLIMVQLNPNATPENTGLDSKRIYAIKKQPKKYSPEQLIKAFQFLCDLDRQVKEGELPTDIMRDYMLVKILNM